MNRRKIRMSQLPLYRKRRVVLSVAILALILIIISVVGVFRHFNETAEQASSVQTKQVDGSLLKEATPQPSSDNTTSDGKSSDSKTGKSSSNNNKDDSNHHNQGTNDSKEITDTRKEVINWRNPSGGPHPNLAEYSNLRVVVNTAQQRVYVQSGGNTIYTMIVSTGMDGSTPQGDYVIYGRGTHFFNGNEQMGADYWVSFLNNVYLFHSVPTRVEQGDYIASEAEKLGEPASHGCVRLTVADSQWLYEQLPDGTPVHID